MLILILIGSSILGLMAVAQEVCSRNDDRKLPAPGRLVHLHGRTIHVQQAGSERPAVVLESGIAASSLNWRLTQRLVSASSAAYSYDRAGFGWSTGPAGCSLSRIADDLHDLIGALGIPNPYILVAHSFGAYIVTAYAQRFSNELAGIVLVDPLTPEEWIAPTSSQRWILRRGICFSCIGGVLEFFGVVRFLLWLLDRGRSEPSRAVLRLFGAKATETIGRILNELSKLPPETIRLIRARWSTPKFFWTMASYIRAVPRCARELAELKIPANVPVTVLSGAHQPELRLREHAAIAAHSINGRHVITDQSGHWIHLDEPELVAEAVRDIINACTISMGLKHEEGR